MDIFNPAPAAETNPPINCDFWPVVDPNDFKKIMRVGGDLITAPRIRQALNSAIISAETTLADKMNQWQIEGYSTLEDVPSAKIDGVSRYVQLWRAAIYAIANADLIESHPDISTTNEALGDLGTLTSTAKDLRRNAIHYLRQILNKNRTRIGII